MRSFHPFPLLFLLLGFLAPVGAARAQTAPMVPVVKLAHLQRYLTSTADTTYIINFWATWCKPCIEELPYFEALTAQYAHQPVKVVLVSMDFARDLEKKVLPFVRRRNLQSTVFLLDESDQNYLIKAVDSTWSGAIPATIFLNGAKKERFLVEKPLTPQQLQEYLTQRFQVNP